jgi:hypothetical protein
MGTLVDSIGLAIVNSTVTLMSVYLYYIMTYIPSDMPRSGIAG